MRTEIRVQERNLLYYYLLLGLFRGHVNVGSM